MVVFIEFGLWVVDWYIYMNVKVFFGWIEKVEVFFDVIWFDVEKVYFMEVFGYDWVELLEILLGSWVLEKC